MAENNSTSGKYATSFRQQFTLRGMIIGAIGSVILTCSSMFVALKASSVPWPIMFVALVSMFGLKALGHTNYNEINVTHTAMSAGAMVAGGLAFTIPGIYMLDPAADLDFAKLLVITVGGVLLGLPRAQAMEMAAQMLIGTAKMMLESGKHPGAIKDMVCSPGGTTIEAVRALEKGAFRASTIEAVVAAGEKALAIKRETEKG